MLTNALDDLPTIAEITPGTISIDRKAIGATSWSAIVTDAACSEGAGLVYYDEVFDTGTGYAEGDSIRITFKSQKITVSANDYEISDATGRIFYTEIRQTERGTDSALTTADEPIDANVTQISASATAADNLELDYIATGYTKTNSTVGTVTNVTNPVTANTTQISGSSLAADRLEQSALTIVTGSAVTGTLTTTQMTTNLTEATDDHYIGRIIIWVTGNLTGQATDITDYVGVNKRLVYTAVTEAPSNGDTFVIL
jgi:hypothetical protein